MELKFSNVRLGNYAFANPEEMALALGLSSADELLRNQKRARSVNAHLGLDDRFRMTCRCERSFNGMLARECSSSDAAL